MSVDLEIERMFNLREGRREVAHDRTAAKFDRLYDSALALIGELVREGKTIFYINVLKKNGTLTGKTQEFPVRGYAIDYLIRNHYV